MLDVKKFDDRRPGTKTRHRSTEGTATASFVHKASACYAAFQSPEVGTFIAIGAGRVKDWT